MSRFTVLIKSLVTIDFPDASEDSSAQLTMSLKSSTTAPIGWLPLHAYPVMYFSVAIISSTDGLSGALCDNIKEISHLLSSPECGTLNAEPSLGGLWPFLV